MNISTASATLPDISKFKCYRMPSDGSLYYGEIMFLNNKTGALVSKFEDKNHLDDKSKCCKYFLNRLLQLMGWMKNLRSFINL